MEIYDASVINMWFKQWWSPISSLKAKMNFCLFAMNSYALACLLLFCIPIQGSFLGIFFNTMPANTLGRWSTFGLKTLLLKRKKKKKIVRKSWDGTAWTKRHGDAWGCTLVSSLSTGELCHSQLRATSPTRKWMKKTTTQRKLLLPPPPINPTAEKNLSWGWKMKIQFIVLLFHWIVVLFVLLPAL